MNPFLGQIILLGFDHNILTPRGWAFCNGQLLSIQTNAALFAIIGTSFGGNGTSTFQLPDLQGRVAIGTGNGSGLTTRVLGEKFGSQSTALVANQLPFHSHAFNANTGAGDTASPSNNLLATGPVIGGAATNVYSTSGGSTMSSQAITANGSNTPFLIMQPYLGVPHCIALAGTFPSRN